MANWRFRIYLLAIGIGIGLIVGAGVLKTHPLPKPYQQIFTGIGLAIAAIVIFVELVLLAKPQMLRGDG